MADAGGRVQRGFFGDLWEGAKSAARAVGGAVKSAAVAVGGAVKSAAVAVGGAVTSAAQWAGDRLHDAGTWIVNLVRDLPGRLVRLGQTVVDGLAGAMQLIPEAIDALKRGGLNELGRWVVDKLVAGAAWAGTLLSRIFDLVGGPELLEFVEHILVGTATRLSGPEIAAAQSVLGPSAVRWGDVRIGESGPLLDLIFSVNEGRAFTTWHTIMMPRGERANLAIVVHELTHVYQYERVGTLYIGQAIHAQAGAGYDYDGAAGLRRARTAGRHFKDFNREQQAQIAQDYYAAGGDRGADPAYQPFIAELRAGQL
jgi:hypothetical protein